MLSKCARQNKIQRRANIWTGWVKIQRNLKVKGESSIQNTEVDRCAPSPAPGVEPCAVTSPCIESREAKWSGRGSRFLGQAGSRTENIAQFGAPHSNRDCGISEAPWVQQSGHKCLGCGNYIQGTVRGRNQGVSSEESWVGQGYRCQLLEMWSWEKVISLCICEGESWSQWVGIPGRELLAPWRKNCLTIKAVLRWDLLPRDLWDSDLETKG